MSFKEVSEHRKAGRLDEALKIALKDYEEAQTSLVIDVESPQGDKKPENIPANLIWPKRALAWVYYEFLKKHSQPASFEIFKENLIKIKELQLPEDEKMVFDNCAWQIGSMIFALNKAEKGRKREPKEPPWYSYDYDKTTELFEIIKSFSFTKSSEAYSFLLKAFLKVFGSASVVLDFADWWGFENFRPEDYLKEEYQGKTLISLVENAYITYSKALLMQVESQEKLSEIKFFKSAKIEKPDYKANAAHFIDRLDEIIKKYPDYQYLPYYKARLLLVSGSHEHALSSFLPFARQKRNDFWIWQVMAESFSESENLKLAFYCKALSLNAREDFLVKVRQAFASLLIENQMYAEAKFEIEKIIETRLKRSWKIPDLVNEWTKTPWYKSCMSQKDNKTLYRKHSTLAEEFLFQEIPEEIVAVEFVNENKNVLTFVQSEKKHGFFKYSGLVGKPKIGDVLKVRFDIYQQDGFCKVFTAKVADSDTNCEAIKTFYGEVKIIPPHNIGFVEDVFVEPRMVQANKLTDKQQVSGNAILSFNKKKNEWGWKAFNI